MEAEKLLQKIKELSSDPGGITDRFMDNAQLYAECFADFLREPNLEQLETAISKKDYPAAFQAAHALKGLSGNLGLTGCSDAVCVLVESLRAKSYGSAEEEYAQVKKQLALLRVIDEDEPQPQPSGSGDRPSARHGG